MIDTFKTYPVRFQSDPHREYKYIITSSAKIPTVFNLYVSHPFYSGVKLCRGLEAGDYFNWDE